jgi:hypothetical protein
MAGNKTRKRSSASVRKECPFLIGNGSPLVYNHMSSGVIKRRGGG